MMGGPDYRDMPDTDNDKVKGSLERETRRIQNPSLGWRKGAFKLSYILYLVDITRVINYSLFLLTGGI